MTLPTLSIQLNEADQQALEAHLTKIQRQWFYSIKPQPNEFGLCNLPRDPSNPNQFLPKFQTDKYTYTIIGENGIGIDRYTTFQKRAIQRGFGRDFQSILDELSKIYRQLGTDTSKADSIVAIRALMDSVADFGREQFDAALWICTLFVLREDETVKEYSEEIALEKIKDWASYGYSELDFFLLSGSVVPGYGKAYNDTIRDNERARQRFLDAIATSGNEGQS